jgi:hypothetical protein
MSRPRNFAHFRNGGRRIAIVTEAAKLLPICEQKKLVLPVSHRSTPNRSMNGGPAAGTPISTVKQIAVQPNKRLRSWGQSLIQRGREDCGFMGRAQLVWLSHVHYERSFDLFISVP